MDVEDEGIKHRELGRLVYLFYFDKVDVDSYFITITTEPERINGPAVRYVMDIDAVVNDAEAHNKIFMDLIRDRMKTEEGLKKKNIIF